MKTTELLVQQTSMFRSKNFCQALTAQPSFLFLKHAGELRNFILREK